jgi:PAS domain S-box-containing protein
MSTNTTEEVLRTSNGFYKRLVEAVTDYTYTVNIDNGHTDATLHGPGCIAVTGYAAEEYKADPFLWYRMVHEEDREAVLEHITKILSGQAVAPLEHRIIHKNGSIRWVKNTSILRYDDQGNLVAYDGLVSDITERKQIEESLARKVEINTGYNPTKVKKVP